MAQLFKRINQLVSANINELLEKIEDPERMIKQVIREMEENIQQTKANVVEAIASEKHLFRELESARRQSRQWMNRAQQALEHNQEALARNALTQKKEIDNVIKELELVWDAAKATSDRLKIQLQQLENQLNTIRRKQTSMIARQRTAQASCHLHHLQDALQGCAQAPNYFERFEEQIVTLEMRNEAWLELEHSPLEQEWLQLQVNQDIEEELAALKAQLADKE